MVRVTQVRVAGGDQYRAVGSPYSCARATRDPLHSRNEGTNKALTDLSLSGNLDHASCDDNSDCHQCTG